MEAIEHDGCRLLRYSAGGGDRPLRKPDIFNTDQGSQFTSFAFTNIHKEADIRISMVAVAAGWTTSHRTSSAANRTKGSPGTARR